MREVSGRCHLVYALAPDGTSAREANDLLNEYVADRSRGLAVWHDHFIGEHGGTVVLEVRDEQEEARLRRPGPARGLAAQLAPAHVLFDGRRVLRTDVVHARGLP